MVIFQTTTNLNKSVADQRLLVVIVHFSVLDTIFFGH